jgi:hypothetical protein
VLVREREALQIIMEQKIRVLVQSIAAASESVLITSPVGANTTTGSSSSAAVTAQAQAAMLKDIGALSRLVQASITALRNANNAPGSMPTTVTKR